LDKIVKYQVTRFLEEALAEESNGKANINRLISFGMENGMSNEDQSILRDIIGRKFDNQIKLLAMSKRMCNIGPVDPSVSDDLVEIAVGVEAEK